MTPANYFSSTSNPEYSQFIALSRYARWLDDKGRRETWEETVDRYIGFFSSHEKLKDLPADVWPKLRAAILHLEVMPSMRALMTAGPALEKCNIAGYNCSYLPVDHPRAFDEAMFISLNGTGVGFSVERQYIAKLPEVAEEFYPTDTTIKVGDSKKGWAKAFRELIAMLYTGQVPKWDVSAVRPAGSRLKTFGGRASGPEPLEALFRFTVDIFKKAKGRKLNSLECHDIMCKIGEVVVVGGVRRSAMISLSNLSDERMRDAKKGQFWLSESQRSLANNSVCYTEKPEFQQFTKEWFALYESKVGERGIYNRVAAKKQAIKTGRRDPDFDFGINPCVTGDMVIEVILKDEDDRFERLSVDCAIQYVALGKTLHIKCQDSETGAIVYSPVVAAGLTARDEEIYKITDSETGKYIRVTANHLVHTLNRGYIKAIELLPTDQLNIK